VHLVGDWILREPEDNWAVKREERLDQCFYTSEERYVDDLGKVKRGAGEQQQMKEEDISTAKEDRSWGA